MIFNFNYVGIFEPVRDLRIFPTDTFNFPIGAKIHYQYLSSGKIDRCEISPKLPEGLDSSFDRLKGIVLGVNNISSTQKYTVTCRNDYSISNEMNFYAAVVAAIKEGFIKANFWVPKVMSLLDCNTKYDPFFDTNLVKTIERFEYTIHHPFSETGKWIGLGPKFSDYWGVEYNGFISIKAEGAYEFTVKSQHGVWIEINGEELVSAPGCRSFNDSHVIIKKTLSAEILPIRILYFHNGGGSGLEIYMSKDNEAKQLIPMSSIGYSRNINLIIS